VNYCRSFSKTNKRTELSLCSGVKTTAPRHATTAGGEVREVRPPRSLNSETNGVTSHHEPSTPKETSSRYPVQWYAPDTVLALRRKTLTFLPYSNHDYCAVQSDWAIAALMQRVAWRLQKPQLSWRVVPISRNAHTSDNNKQKIKTCIKLLRHEVRAECLTFSSYF
jgi:hypothetical protein